MYERSKNSIICFIFSHPANLKGVFRNTANEERSDKNLHVHRIDIVIQIAEIGVRRFKSLLQAYGGAPSVSATWPTHIGFVLGQRLHINWRGHLVSLAPFPRAPAL